MPRIEQVKILNLYCKVNEQVNNTISLYTDACKGTSIKKDKFDASSLIEEINKAKKRLTNPEDKMEVKPDEIDEDKTNKEGEDEPGEHLMVTHLKFENSLYFHHRQVILGSNAFFSPKNKFLSHNN